MKHADELDPYLTLLRRRLRGRHRYDLLPCEPAALANVVLLVLLFYIYASAYVVRLPGVRLQLPEIQNAEGVPYGSLVLTISRDSLLFFNDQRTSLDDLREVFNRAAFERGGRGLVIEADEFVQTATLMRVIDLARGAGIRDVVVAGRLPARVAPPAGAAP